MRMDRALKLLSLIIDRALARGKNKQCRPDGALEMFLRALIAGTCVPGYTMPSRERLRKASATPMGSKISGAGPSSTGGFTPGYYCLTPSASVCLRGVPFDKLTTGRRCARRRELREESGEKKRRVGSRFLKRSGLRQRMDENDSRPWGTFIWTGRGARLRRS